MCLRLVLFLMLLNTEVYPQSWSPDGTKLVFDDYDVFAKSAVIYTVNADGSNLKKLTDRGGSPTWAADGKIYFRGDTGLYAINPDGSGPMSFYEDGISVSPDGQHVLLFHNNGDFSSVLKMSTTDGSSVIELSHFSDSDRLNSSFLWSPDSQKVAFSLAHGQGMSEPVFLAVVPGNKNLNTTINGGFSWGPDSNTIVYDKEGSTYAIDINTVFKIKEKLLIKDGIGPVWSPDRMRIAFVSGSAVPGATDTWDIYVQDTEGTERARLTEDSDQELNFTWSPDGTRIAFMTEFPREGIPGKRIHILDTEARHRITSVSGKSWGEIKSQPQR